MEAIVFARNGQALNSSKIIAQDAFRVVEGRPVTSSRIVADYFEKQHHHVVRDIRALIAQKPDLQASANFGEWSEEVEIGSGAKRTVRGYWMDKKGFSILAMGFTGAKALDFKCAFYDEFERMEKELHPTVTCPVKSQLPPPTLTEQQAYTIMSEVAKRAKRDGSKYQTIYRALKARYQVTKYTNIRQADFNDAVEFIRAVDLRTPVAHDAEPEEEGVWVPVSYIKRQQQFVYEMRYLFRECFTKFHRFLQLVDSPLSGRFYEMYTSLNLVGIESELTKLGYPVSDLVNFKRTPRPNAYIGR